MLVDQAPPLKTQWPAVSRTLGATMAAEPAKPPVPWLKKSLPQVRYG